MQIGTTRPVSSTNGRGSARRVATLPRVDEAVARQLGVAVLRASLPKDRLPDEVVAGTLESLLTLRRALPPAGRTVLDLSLRLLDAGARTPRERFRRLRDLDVEAARRYLDTWQHRPIALRRIALLARDLLLVAYYEQPAVRARLGYLPDPWIADVAQRRRIAWADDIAAHQTLLRTPAPLRDTAETMRAHGAIRPATELPADAHFDVVVVGSGAGGAVVAAELAEAGLRVAVLEEGDHHPTERFTTDTLEMLCLLYRDCGASTTLGRSPIQFSEGRCVGGSTVVNGGMTFRAAPRVLDAWRAHSGIADLDLTTEYERVERFLSVRLPDGASIGRDQQLLKAGAEALGWRTIECTRAHVHCGGCNVCVWGCPTGAKQSTLVSYLPRAVHFGATVWTGARVERVLFHGKRAIGVRATVDGRTIAVHARRVVVAAGAVQTPALLQRSKITTPSRQVGRNLTLHPGAAVAAVFDDPVDGWTGAHESYQVREFEEEGIILAAVNLPPSLTSRVVRSAGRDIDDVLADYGRMVTAGVLVEDTRSGRVRAVGKHDVAVTYPVSDQDAARVVRAVTLLGEALFAAGARRVYLPVDQAPAAQSVDELRRLADTRVPAQRLDLTTVHLMGTARIGADALTSVCDPFGAVRDADALYVADASLFPGPVGVNPQLTVMALATRVAGRIIDEW
jgi:choline dehydrogenase-like flavoprotein